MAFTASGMACNSPALSSIGCEERMRSTSVVPVRGMPMMNTGASCGASARADMRPAILHGLEIGGILRAVIGELLPMGGVHGLQGGKGAGLLAQILQFLGRRIAQQQAIARRPGLLGSGLPKGGFQPGHMVGLHGLFAQRGQQVVRPCLAGAGAIRASSAASASATRPMKLSVTA
jgi:hypothetical protein